MARETALMSRPIQLKRRQTFHPVAVTDKNIHFHKKNKHCHAKKGDKSNW